MSYKIYNYIITYLPTPSVVPPDPHFGNLCFTGQDITASKWVKTFRKLSKLGLGLTSFGPKQCLGRASCVIYKVHFIY